MSIFTKTVKTFKTDILGREIELKSNLAVWLYLEADFGIKQGEWNEVYLKEKNVATAKFLVSILKANGYKTTIEEVLENVNDTELELFILKYQEAMYGITDDSEMGKNILNEKVEDLVNIPDHQPKQKKNKKNKKNKKSKK